MKLRHLPVLIPLLAFGECGGPSIVVPLPEHCQRIENQALPGFAASEYGTYRLEHTAALGEALPAQTDTLSLRTWLTRVQVTALDGATLDFLDEIALAVIYPDGTEVDAARFTAPDSPGSVLHLQPTGADLLPAIGADGAARIVLRYQGTLPSETVRMNVTACIGGEAEYALEL